MTTKALNLVTDQPTDLESDSDKEESISDDDTNNNAHDKVPPKFPLLKIHESVSKSDGRENEESSEALQLLESSLILGLKDDIVKVPQSKNATLMRDLKTDSPHRPRNQDDIPGSLRNSVVLPLLISEQGKDESSQKSEKGFSKHMSQSVVATDSKTLTNSDAVKSETEMTKNTVESVVSDHSTMTPTKSLSSMTTSEPFGSSQLSRIIEVENCDKNRQKLETQSPSQAAPVKPRCAPAREAVDPAKYFTLTDEPDGTKYACSKCGNVYKWRKSLNKHWKEKHDGEVPNLHARPPPSLLQREQFLGPLRGTAKHSVFHQPGFHATGIHSKPSAAPIVSPPRLHLMHGGKNPHGMSPYLFGKFPIKDEDREIGKSIHQTEEPVTAVVRPSRSAQPPIAHPRWSKWLSSTNRAILELPSPQKLKIPTVESMKSAHDQSQPRDSFGQMFSAIQGHHSFRGGPLDLSGTLVSRCSGEDDSVLDLSRKSSSDLFSSTVDGTASVQEEPLDFSAKSLSKSLGYPKSVGATSSGASFSANWFPVLEKKDSLMSKVVDFSDISVERSSSSFSIDGFDKPGQVFCACCHEPCRTIAELNHHFARYHMTVLYEASFDSNSGGHHCTTSSTQVTNTSGNQLWKKYLPWENAKRSLACVVCGMPVQWSWMLGKHFEQMHSSIQPNPYKKGSAVSAGVGNSSHLDSGANPAALVPDHRSETFSFSADSNAEFSQHQLKRSLAKEKMELELLRNSEYLQIRDDNDDVEKKSPVLKCSSGSQFSKFADEIVDLEDVNTAIVIPQAPEETYLVGSSNKYQNDVVSPDGSPPPLGKLPYDTGMTISEESTVIVIPQAPEEASIGSSPVYSTPSGSKCSRMKKEAGLSTESLLPFKCELCEYRARWPSEMMQHMKNHSDEKPYQCPQCAYRSKWKWDVVKHLKRCGGGGSVKDVVDTTAKKKSYVKSLLSDPHSHRSTYDSGQSYDSTGFPRFYEQSDSSKLPDSFSKGPPNITVYSGMNGLNGSPEGLDSSENCDSEDTISEDFLLNKSEPGNEPSQSNHGCLQCPFVGHSPAELRRHLRVHSDEKPYSCQTCNYSSKWKCDLKKHVKAYNHTAAVSQNNGGHKKKPDAWSQMSCLDGKAAVFGESDLKCLFRGGRHRKNELELEMPSSCDGGSIFGGITSGGRLRCRQCEFEAVDITSFLQHKTMHRNDETIVRKHDGGAIKRKSPLPSHHHRRKSVKQTRVIPADGKELSDGSNRNFKITDNVVDREAQNLDTKRFWDSLGLQSISMVRPKMLSSMGESKETCDDLDSSDPEMEIDSVGGDFASKCIEYDQPEYPEFMKQSSQTSSTSYESSSDVGTEHDETNGFGVCQKRAKSDLEMGSVEDMEKFSNGNPKDMKASGYSLIKKPFQVLRRGMRQGVTTTEAEDAAGMSKRKRKLRTCEKCGYITDNLTTLQRHAAKHGSGGRHQCWMCDYSVDRQHVLEYHMKIVHEGGNRASEITAEEWNCGTKAEKVIGGGKRSPENIPRNDDQIPTFDRGIFGGKRRIVCTTSVITVRGHEMEMIQKGNKTWYNCIKCHFVSSNITNAVNHAKQHGANKKYKCKYCDYSLDRKSSIANHMNSLHSQSDVFRFDAEPEKDLVKSRSEQWMEELCGNEFRSRKFSLLDKMSVNWKRRTCVKCGFSSINPTRMLLHRLAHGSLDKEFGCETCGYRTMSSRLLESHVKSHKLSELIDCSCESISSVRQSGSPSADQKQHCEKCFDVSNLSSLEFSRDPVKIQNRIGKISLENRKSAKSAKIKCLFCPFVSFSMLKFTIHSQHHNSLKKLSCSKCSFRANVRNVLYHHQKLHH